MLSINALDAFYGKSQVLRGVDLDIGSGEIVALLGRNGTGRSTLAKAIMGLVGRQGSIKLNGREIGKEKTFQIARCGIGYVPENRDVFPKLTVQENLRLGE
ncbi:MAG: ATP-binding cassette domain-containing protein, partial [Hoeflea sp. D1-CHI-28]